MKKANKKDVKSIKKPVKSKITHKLKFIRKFSSFNSILSEIAIFDDKKILAKSHDEIKVYDNKFNLIYKNAKHTIEYLKILDNDNILLLNSEHQLINLNIKEKKSKILLRFKHKFSEFLYINKNIIITAEEEVVKGIQIWKLINNWTYQLASVLKFPKDNLDHIFPLIYYYKANNLLLTNDTKYGRANFWDIKTCKIKDFVLLNEGTENEYQILSFCPIKNDVFIFGMGEADWNTGIFNLVLYDFKGKKILLKKEFDYIIKEIAYIKEKDVILISGGSHDYQQSDIYMYDGSLNELQFIPKVNYTGICGFTYYEKNVKEKFILVGSEGGEMFVYSII